MYSIDFILFFFWSNSVPILLNCWFWALFRGWVLTWLWCHQLRCPSVHLLARMEQKSIRNATRPDNLTPPHPPPHAPPQWKCHLEHFPLNANHFSTVGVCLCVNSYWQESHTPQQNTEHLHLPSETISRREVRMTTTSLDGVGGATPNQTTVCAHVCCDGEGVKTNHV